MVTDEVFEKAYAHFIENVDAEYTKMMADAKNKDCLLYTSWFFFVKEQYPEVIKKMQKIDIDYTGVLDYLANNQEVPYSNPEAPSLAQDVKAKLLKVKDCLLYTSWTISWTFFDCMERII